MYSCVEVLTRPSPVPAEPTAVQAVADVHDTPFKVLVVAFFGLGVAWIFQVVPFQTSARVV